MATSSASATVSRSAGTPWWVVLLQGIFAVLIGLLLIISPGKTVLVLIQLLGFYWLIAGIFSLVSIFIDQSLWGWKLFTGVLGILAGFLILDNPLWSTVLVPATLVIILGIEGIIMGVVGLIQAFQGGGWGIGILGVLSILFGVVLVVNPLIGALTLSFVLGGLAIVGGIAAIIFAFQMR
ncbi:MAG: HdeD family acid-resistance protein [Anaerolineales bacterium]|jgi:uncharacterized membrane protein HdeD (DUF308 family)